MAEKIQKRVLIVGGGFGGIAAALALRKQGAFDMKITLISDKPHFEYKPALYRVVTGRSPLEVCIPITEILKEDNGGVKFTNDTVKEVDLVKKLVTCISGNYYEFDYLILALGSEATFFNIPGLREFSFGFTTIREAMRLKAHIHDLFEECNKAGQDEKVCLLHIVIVGAGPSGVELAGELAIFINRLAKKYNADQSLVTLDLIEAAPRILPALPENVAARIARRLRYLGINIFTNRPMTKEEYEEITVRGMTMRTETVIWTAGVKPNSLYQKINGLEFDRQGRVIVDEYLRPKGFQDIFVLGDGAATKNSGMAQTAIFDGKFAAANIINTLAAKPLQKYVPKKTYYAIPVGPGWAATDLGLIKIYGRLGLIVRRLADFLYFLSILPPSKALTVFRRGKNLCDKCGICVPD